MENMKGKTLGRYHLVEPLGEGGMAVVYKAYDANLERNVAIKVIRTDRGMDENFHRRFQREAKALAQLDHPYILKVLDYGEQDGIPYLVMPFVPGGTLKQRMGKPFSAADAARILAPIARALEYAHQQGIIHRDVKPANILIIQSGSPVLSDFGIARILETQESNQLTATGVGIGTPDYMAPEQWLGTSDPRTDIYALGIVFYEMVTGRRPYTADTPAAVLIKHMQDPLPRPSDFAPGLPEAAEHLIFRALAKDPGGRFADMGQMAAAFERLALNIQPESFAGMDSQTETVVDESLSKPFTIPPSRSMAEIATPSMQPAVEPNKGSWQILGIAGGLVILLMVVCLAAGGVVFALNFNNIKQAILGGSSSPTVIATDVIELMSATQAPQKIEPSATPAANEPTATAIFDQPTSEMPEVINTSAPLTQIEGMPEDIPLLPDNNGDLITQDTGDMKIYMYTTSLSMEETETFFQEEMKRLGWQVDSTTTIRAQDSIIYTYNKDDRMVMLYLILIDYENGPQTTVELMIQNP